jgi:hypothetical protein
MVPLVSRIAGSSWRVDLENLFYSVCDDEDIIYRAGTMMTTRTDGRYGNDAVIYIQSESYYQIA